MRVLAADDEILQLEKLVDTIREVIPDAEINQFQNPVKLLASVSGDETPYDIAFLDIQMGTMSGVTLAKCLKDLNPKLNIIFVSGFEEYKGEAMDLKASGYIVKPVTRKQVEVEVEELRYPVQNQAITAKPNTLLRAQCFGNFDVFDNNNQPIRFDRSKAKELLAYLICKQGSRCTTRELIGVLFEDEAYSLKVRDHFQHVASSMMRGLKQIGAEKAINRDRQNYAVNVDLIDCDYYRFKDLDAQAVKSYTGEFMNQYSWAEFITGYLDRN